MIAFVVSWPRPVDCDQASRTLPSAAGASAADSLAGCAAGAEAGAQALKIDAPVATALAFRNPRRDSFLLRTLDTSSSTFHI